MAAEPEPPPAFQSPLAAEVREEDARDSVRRHSRHLAQLAENLRRLGLDEELVDAGVMDIFRQYEQALARYIDGAGERRVP